MYKNDMGAETSEGQKIEENVQFGPLAPQMNVALPEWIGSQSTLMYVVGGVVGAYLLYNYIYARGE